MYRRSNKHLLRCFSVLIGIAVIMGMGIVTFADDATFDLQGAIDAAEKGATITLMGNVENGVNISADKEITIDLNGYSISTTDEFAIENAGDLTIKGSGLVKGNRRAITNNGDISLIGGVYTNISESGYVVYNAGTAILGNITVTANQDNTGRYAIYNNGEMTINEGTTVTTFGTSSQLHSGSNIVNDAEGLLTIDGGVFEAPLQNICCLNSEVEPYSSGTVVIKDGEFSATRTNNGRNIYFNYNGGKPQDGSLTIEGGVFTSGCYNIYSYSKDYWTTSLISGGRFSSKLFAYNARGITVENANVSPDNPDFIKECSSISIMNLTSDKEINASSVQDGVVINGPILKIEDLSDKAMWYAGSEATKQVKDATTGTKVTVVYGILTTSINHDICITVPSTSTAYINNKIVSADGQEHVIHVDLALVNDHPCLSPDSPKPYYCSDCDKYYEDASGTVEIADIDDVVYVYNHDISAVPAKDPTTDADGYEAHYKCKTCGDLFSDAEGNNPISSPVVIPKVTPTKAPDVSIMIDRKTASVVCGNTITFKAVVKGSTDKVSWKTSDKAVATIDSNGKLTAKKAGTVTVTASIAGKSATCPVTVLYKDVTNNEEFWYAPTNYLTAANVVKGYDNQTTFKPANECSRAQMVTFLWRLSGEPKPKSTKTDFTDIKTSDYFYKPVLWAVEKGITTGVSKTKFDPQAICTRAQTVTFLWRMAGKPAPKSSSCKFTDVKSKDYFYKPTIWASEMKIVAGYDNNTFKPQGKCLRRQMVTFLYKYDKYVNGKG